MTIDVLDYLGKHKNGILVFISLGYDGEYYQASFYYQESMLVLTPEDKLEDKLGCLIEDWEGYPKLMMDILKKVVPYNEIINRIDEFDPSKYNLYLADQSSNSSSNSSPSSSSKSS